MVAQVDDTLAQVFLAEDESAEAELAAPQIRSTVLAKPDAIAFLAEALVTYSIALARRLTKTMRAQLAFSGSY